MAGTNKFNIFSKLADYWDNLTASSNRSEKNGNYDSKEKIIAFTLAFLLALGFWFLVNLSRTFNITVNVPIEAGTVPENKALIEPLPDFASVSVSGEGWSLINFYNKPPVINIDIQDSQVNLFDQARERMNALPEVEVLKVQPNVLSITLEDEITIPKKVNSRLSLSFKKQFGLLDSLKMYPDSVLISGAASIVERIETIQTKQISLSNVNEDIRMTVQLEKPESLIELNRETVQVTGNVAEFTEGEIRVRVQITDTPSNMNVNFSPSIVTIKYDVPIQEYTKSQGIVPYRAIVPYERLREDSTGFVQPEIVSTTDSLHTRLRNYNPTQIAYFHVVTN